MTPTCTGKTNDGEPCPCIRFKSDPNQNPGAEARCMNCKHWDTTHPESTFDISQLIGTFAKSSSTPSSASGSQAFPFPSGGRVTADDAFKETNAGLRRSSQRADRVSSKTKKGAKGKAVVRHSSGLSSPASGQEVKLGKVVLLPYGLDEDGGDLLRSKIPDKADIVSLSLHGLAVIRTETQEALVLHTGWSYEEVDRWIQGLLPAPFAFLREQITSDVEKGPMWRLLHGKSSKASLVELATPSGAYLEEFIANKRRRWSERTLYLVSRYEIPEDIWQSDWIDSPPSPHEDTQEVAVKRSSRNTTKRSYEEESLDSGDETTTSSGSESDVVVLEAPKGKGKQRAIPTPRPRKKKRASSPSGLSPPVTTAPSTSEDVDTSISHTQPLAAEHIAVDEEAVEAGSPLVAQDHPLFAPDYTWPGDSDNSRPATPVAGSSTEPQASTSSSILDDFSDTKAYFSLKMSSQLKNRNPW